MIPVFHYTAASPQRARHLTHVYKCVCNCEFLGGWGRGTRTRNLDRNCAPRGQNQFIPPSHVHSRPRQQKGLTTLVALYQH